MADHLRSGIVRAGFIGEVHAHAIRGAGGVVAAVASSNPRSSAAAVSRLRAERAVRSAEELVDADDVVGHPQGYVDCFTAFVADVYAAAAGNPPDGLPTFADGLRAALITDAVVTSAARGSWVELPA
jgi:predicted dehydrogenase